MIFVDSLTLVATWSKPFSLQGEELSYVVSITNIDVGMVKEVIVNTTNYTLTKQNGQHDCTLYQFTVFSKNGYSRSINAVSGRKKFPAGRTYYNKFMLKCFAIYAKMLSWIIPEIML